MDFVINPYKIKTKINYLYNSFIIRITLNFIYNYYICYYKILCFVLTITRYYYNMFQPKKYIYISRNLSLIFIIYSTICIIVRFD